MTWEAARQKRRFFTKTGSKVPFSQGIAGLHPLYGRAGPLTFKNLRGVTPGPGVREHGADADIGDEFVASLVAQPTEVLKSLDMLDLSDNEITAAGCATLATALRGGALKELTDLRLDGNPASGEAQGAATTLPDDRAEALAETDGED